MNDKEVIAAIRQQHLKANIWWIEEANGRHPSGGRVDIHWERARVDRGGTIFGSGPYLHVPITNYWGGHEETVHRVYAPARLRRQLARAWKPTPKSVPPSGAGASDAGSDKT